MVTECFLTCFWSFLISNKLEQLEFKLKKIIGIEKHAGKVTKKGLWYIRSTGGFQHFYVIFSDRSFWKRLFQIGNNYNIPCLIFHVLVRQNHCKYMHLSFLLQTHIFLFHQTGLHIYQTKCSWIEKFTPIHYSRRISYKEKE